ncbi:MAG: threonine--tRNA ligase, partial [Hydrogenothermaceae bacterium]|nr:threonine--tRNA ligase [Hydrogenothermaceae bacterium]
MIDLVLENEGKIISIEENKTLKDILQSLNGKYKDVIGAVVDGEIIDIHTPIKSGKSIKLITKKDPESLEILRHSLAHIMAQALKEIYGDENVHLGIGPTTENGFYYDVEIEGYRLTDEDLPKIEEKMREIIKRGYKIEREALPREEAIKFFESKKEIYKIDIIKHNIPEGEEITVYKQGEFTDLCRGPHLPSTDKAGAFKLISVSGAYWRGKETNPMLQRIYGVAFWDEKELKNYLNMLEEAKKRDHRKLGKDLDLFSIDDEVGPGLVLWHPNGALIRHIIETYWKEEHLKNGYKLVYTPHIGRAQLWLTSGHLGYYKENMYTG